MSIPVLLGLGCGLGVGIGVGVGVWRGRVAWVFMRCVCGVCVCHSGVCA